MATMAAIAAASAVERICKTIFVNLSKGTTKHVQRTASLCAAALKGRPRQRSTQGEAVILLVLRRWLQSLGELLNHALLFFQLRHLSGEHLQCRDAPAADARCWDNTSSAAFSQCLDGPKCARVRRLHKRRCSRRCRLRLRGAGVRRRGRCARAGASRGASAARRIAGRRRAFATTTAPQRPIRWGKIESGDSAFQARELVSQRLKLFVGLNIPRVPLVLVVVNQVREDRAPFSRYFLPCGGAAGVCVSVGHFADVATPTQLDRFLIGCVRADDLFVLHGAALRAMRRVEPRYSPQQLVDGLLFGL
mmetsp:Transcript_65649/g.182660  ORF Transcript_65649/g.182660 Transcript_65649/m.182660 type:complete len:306 (+) Transcript_65649:70-987(+)